MKMIGADTTLNNGLSFNEITQRYRDNEFEEDFISLFGDLSSYIFKGSIDLQDINLCSLKGFPAKLVSCDYLCLNNNPELEDLKGLPTDLSEVKELYLDLSQVSMLTELELKSYANSFVFIDIDERITAENMVMKLLDIIKAKKGTEEICFSSNLSAFDTSELINQFEHFASLYKKVGYNQEKLERTLKLL